MSLHGPSNDSWNRFSAGGSWDYQILSAGFKYNLTDLAAALGRQRLRKAASLGAARGRIAARYAELLGDVAEVELPSALERLSLPAFQILHRHVAHIGILASVECDPGPPFPAASPFLFFRAGVGAQRQWGSGAIQRGFGS